MNLRVPALDIWGTFQIIISSMDKLSITCCCDVLQMTKYRMKYDFVRTISLHVLAYKNLHWLRSWIIQHTPVNQSWTKFLKDENFHFKVTRNKNITGAKLLRIISSSKLNKDQKVKCSLVWFVHSILLVHDRSKIVDLSHINMEDDLNFFENYAW